MEDFLRERITRLRISKGVSEYQMSYDLGHSRSYINNISSGKSMPSMVEFFAICDYFGITPTEFFNEESENPYLLAQAVSEMRSLSDNDMSLIIELARKLSSGRKQ